MLRVLLVDDSKIMLRGMKNIIEGLGYEVVATGRDGLEGLEQFQLHHPDVTLLDITMPNMSGVDCLTKIKELDSEAKVVMLSAVQDQDTVSKCLEIGATSFLKKPIRPHEPDDLARLQKAILEAAEPQVQ